MRRAPPSADGALRVLNESEIQNRLYGQYLPDPPRGKAALQGGRPVDSEWTGAEILEGELRRLRQELIRLRQEREKLENDLTVPSPPEGGASSKLSSRDVPQGGASSWLSRWWGMGGLLLWIGLLLRAQLLQALPAPAETAPFTVQVGVYHVASVAERALRAFKDLGYSAFLVETRRRNGRPSYQICVGKFVTSEEAGIERHKLISDPRFSDAFVRLQ